MDVSEDAIHLIDELDAEYCLAQPELFIFCENHVMDVVGNLWDYGSLLSLFGVDKCVRIKLAQFFWGKVNSFYVINYVVYLGHIVELHSLIDNNVGVLHLFPKLTHRLYHRLVHLTIILHVLHVAVYVLIFTSESLLSDVRGLELLHDCIIEVEPSRVFVLSVLDERVVVALIGGTVMHHNAFQLVLVVIFRDLSLQNMQFVLVEIILRKILIFHFLDKILSSKLLLTVCSHVKIHRKLTIIIYFNFLHGIKVKLKSFENQE